MEQWQLVWLITTKVEGSSPSPATNLFDRYLRNGLVEVARNSPQSYSSLKKTIYFYKYLRIIDILRDIGVLYR